MSTEKVSATDPATGTLVITRLFDAPREQALDFQLFFSRKRQERRSSAASVVAVEVARVFDSADAEAANDEAVDFCDALLLFFGQLQVMILPRKIDFRAGLRSAGGEGQDCARGADLKCTEDGGGRAHVNLEADFF